MSSPSFVQLSVQVNLLALKKRFPIMIVSQTMNECNSTLYKCWFCSNINEEIEAYKICMMKTTRKWASSDPDMFGTCIYYQPKGFQFAPITSKWICDKNWKKTERVELLKISIHTYYINI